MARRDVQVSASLLSDPGLTAPAKVIWMVLRLHDPTTLGLVQARAGISRPTLLKSVAQLAAAGWYAGAPTEPASAGDAPKVALPALLLEDDRVWVRSRVLYGMLQLLPSFRCGAGEFTYAELSHTAHTAVNTAKRAVRQLVAAGWLETAQTRNHAPIRFRLADAEEKAAQIEVARAERRLKVGYRGEALMREYLSLLVDAVDYQDNARPGFLANPSTDQPLELDRFYPPGVAFEYNGVQHYQANGRFTEEDVRRQRGRDLIKQGLCLLHQITLVVIRNEDLSLKAMQQKIGDLLPTRSLEGHERLITFLEATSRGYRYAASRARRADR